MAVISDLEEINNSDVPIINTLPLEIISKIVLHLSLPDILALSRVSKIWRTHYINQNIIWRSVCQKMNLRELEYTKCFTNIARNNAECKSYVETISAKLFGPFCLWWSIFNRYNMVLKNIKANDFATIHVPRKLCETAYCTDDYIITVNRYRKQPIRVTILKYSSTPVIKKYLRVYKLFRTLIATKENKVKIIGNKKFVVLEIHSILFVYAIENGEFVKKYATFMLNPEENGKLNPEDLATYLAANNNTTMAIDDEELVLVQPNEKLVCVYDLANKKMTRKMNYTPYPNTVQCLKYDSKRLMIGIKVLTPAYVPDPHQAVIYHLEDTELPFTVSLFGAVNHFKVTPHLIGVENEASETPFIIYKSEMYRVFWVDCDTFAIDSTRQFIYYNLNASIFKYDLKKCLLENFEVTQKIAVDIVAQRYTLIPINDRFLIIRSTRPHAFDIYDVKDYITVRSIHLNSDYSLVHVGKLSIVFANKKEFRVIGFY